MEADDIDDDLAGFLKSILHHKAFPQARQACLAGQIFSFESLKIVQQMLDKIFAIGTAETIRINIAPYESKSKVTALPKASVSVASSSSCGLFYISKKLVN